MEKKTKKIFDLMKELKQIKERQKEDRILIEHLLQELQRIKENRKKDKFLIQYLLDSTTNRAIKVSNLERTLSMRISNLERHDK